jgi:hypothetical protein
MQDGVGRITLMAGSSNLKRQTLEKLEHLRRNACRRLDRTDGHLLS